MKLPVTKILLRKPNTTDECSKDSHHKEFIKGAKILNTFFASVSIIKQALNNPMTLRPAGNHRARLTIGGGRSGLGVFKKLDKCMELEGMHPWMLRGMTPSLWSHSIIFERWWPLEDTFKDQKKANVTLNFENGRGENPETYRLIRLTLIKE